MIKSLQAFGKGFYTVLKHLFKRAITLEYPEKMANLPDSLRGKHSLNGCIACETCVRVCPANAITIEKNDNKKLKSFKIDTKKCIFCGNCQYYCPVKAIRHSKHFELATSERDDLVYELFCKEEEGRC